LIQLVPKQVFSVLHNRSFFYGPPLQIANLLIPTNLAVSPLFPDVLSTLSDVSSLLFLPMCSSSLSLVSLVISRRLVTRLTTASLFCSLSTPICHCSLFLFLFHINLHCDFSLSSILPWNSALSGLEIHPRVPPTASPYLPLFLLLYLGLLLFPLPAPCFVLAPIRVSALPRGFCSCTRCSVHPMPFPIIIISVRHPSCLPASPSSPFPTSPPLLTTSIPY
jgi:hypothetical protein